MQTKPDPNRLRFGKYRTPRFCIGDVAFCAIRGECEIVGQSDARIPWPIGKIRQGRFLIMFDALERAVRQEASIAVCYHFGVTAQTVTKWRKALGVGRMTAGSMKLASEHGKSPARAAGLEKAQAKARDPERRAKIAAGVARGEETERGDPTEDERGAQATRDGAAVGKEVEGTGREMMRRNSQPPVHSLN